MKKLLKQQKQRHQIAIKNGDIFTAANMKEIKADVLKALGDFEKAKKEYKEVIKLYEKCNAQNSIKEVTEKK